MGRKLLQCAEKEGWDAAEAGRFVRLLCKCCKWKQKKLTAFVSKQCSDLVMCTPKYLSVAMSLMSRICLVPDRAGVYGSTAG